MAKNNADWLQHLRSPHVNMMKKYIWQMIDERALKHESIIEKICGNIYTTEEIESLGKLLADIYECGFLKCLDQHKQQLADAGLLAKIVPENKEGIAMKSKPIFHEKSG